MNWKPVLCGLLIALPVVAQPFVRSWEEVDKALQTEGASVRSSLEYHQVTRQGDKYILNKGGEQETLTREQFRTFMLTVSALNGNLSAAEMSLGDVPGIVKWATNPANVGKFLILKGDRETQVVLESRADGKIAAHENYDQPLELFTRANFGAELQKARQQGQWTACKSNLKNLATGLEMYASDFGGHYPRTLKGLTPSYLRYLPTCPAAGKVTYTYQVSSKPDAFTMQCKGWHHKAAGAPKDKPAYTAEQGLMER
jgi:hypothetical protein